jgi:DNA-binding transcriptional MerR regulator
LRPVDLARRVGISVQSVRAYERWGFLPAAPRSAAGHRQFTALHLHAIEAARTMIEGFGWQTARDVMAAVHRGEPDAALEIVDARHADLHRRRRELEATLATLRTVGTHLEATPRLRRPDGVRVGEAAQQAGVRASALRFWEQQGLLHPTRDVQSGFRVYDTVQLRRLRVVVLLREAGYGFEAIRTVLDELAAGQPRRALIAVEHRRQDLAHQSHACTRATAAFWTYFEAWRSQANERETPDRASQETGI